MILLLFVAFFFMKEYLPDTNQHYRKEKNIFLIVFYLFGTANSLNEPEENITIS